MNLVSTLSLQLLVRLLQYRNVNHLHSQLGLFVEIISKCDPLMTPSESRHC